MMPHLKAKFGNLADYMYRNSLNISSQRSYHSKFNLFIQFLQNYHISLYETDEGVLIAYIISRAAAKISHTTIKHDLYALQTSLFDLDIQLSISSMPILEKVLHGIKRMQGSDKKPKQKLPITPDLLKKLLCILPQSNDIPSQIYRTAFTIATFGMLRCGEFTNTTKHALLRIKHLTLIKDPISDNYIRLHLHLPASKTDVFRHGVTIPLPCICNQFSPCPVHEAAHLLNLYRKQNLPVKPNDPLFHFPDNRILQRNDVTTMITTLCKANQIPAEAYSGHSFRKGGASSLAMQGAPDWMIQTLGRWKSSSYKNYITTPPETICQYIQTMIT